MSSLTGILEQRLADGLRGVLGGWGNMPLFVPTKDERFGDYQCNAVLSCAKRLGVKPRELAEKAAEVLRTDGADFFSEVSIAGPGFINLRLKDGFLRASLPPKTVSAAAASPVRSAASPRAASRPWSTIPVPTSLNRCTSATCAAPSSAILSAGC